MNKIEQEAEEDVMKNVVDIYIVKMRMGIDTSIIIRKLEYLYMKGRKVPAFLNANKIFKNYF